MKYTSLQGAYPRHAQQQIKTSITNINNHCTPLKRGDKQEQQKTQKIPTLPMYPFCPQVTPAIRDNRQKLEVDIWAKIHTNNTTKLKNITDTLTKQQPTSRVKDDSQPHMPPVSTADKTWNPISIPLLTAVTSKPLNRSHVGG